MNKRLENVATVERYTLINKKEKNKIDERDTYANASNCGAENTAITLIALIITIIVLLILAGVVLNMVIGENGIFSKANDAKKQTEIAEGKEKIELEYIDLCVNKAENEEKIPTYDEWITALETKKIINEYDGETQKINGQVSTISVPTLSENEYPVVQIKNKKYKFYIRIEDGKAVYIDEDPDASGDESYNNEIGTTEKISYSGNYQEYVVEDTGYYKIECWGASGQDYSSYKGGRGAYTSGIIKLNKNDKLYIYAGGQGSGGTGGYNGGANSGAGAGGGATDIRLISGATNNIESLKSRIMVAGAGGGAAYNSYGNGGAAGGLVGREGSPDSRLDIETYKAATGGTQTAGGSKSDFGPGWGSDTDGKEDGKFGLGGKSSTGSGWQGGAGGAGYYGGGGGASGYCYAGAGGSSFISGHDGCRAIDFTASTSSIVHKADSVFKYNNKEYKFIKTTMIDGEGYAWTTDKGNLQQMPKPAGGNYETGEGHSGNGYAKITFYGNNVHKLDEIEEHIEEYMQEIKMKNLNNVNIKSGLVNYWPLKEDMEDLAGGYNFTNPSGNVTFEDGCAHIGVNDYLVFDKDNFYKLQGNQTTVLQVKRVGDWSGWGLIFGYEDPCSSAWDHYSLYYDSYRNKIALYNGDAYADYNAFSTEYIPKNEWVTIAVVTDGNDTKIYFNNEVQTITQKLFKYEVDNKRLCLGGQPANLTFPEAYFKNCAIFNRALSAEEIRNLF